MIPILIFISQLSQASAGSTPTCPSTAYTFQETLGCVAYFSQKESWLGAQIKCRETNGWLLIPYSPDHIDAIAPARVNLNKPTETIWLNAYRRVGNCMNWIYDFKYLKGGFLGDSLPDGNQGDWRDLSINSDSRWKWEPGEPNSCSENAIEMYADYTLNDEKDSDKHQFFCQVMYQCDAGYALGTLKNPVCKLCTEGKYETNGVCANCPMGKYNENEGSVGEASCVLCEAGKYNDMTGKSICNNCEFKPSKDAGKATCDNTPCKDGQQWNIQLQGCYECPAGSFSNSKRVSNNKCVSCQDTFPGVFPLSNIGRSACTQCESNKVVPAVNLLAVEHCQTCQYLEFASRFWIPDRQFRTCKPCSRTRSPHYDKSLDKSNPNIAFVEQFNDGNGICKSCDIGKMFDPLIFYSGASDGNEEPCVRMDGLRVTDGVLNGVDYYYDTAGSVKPVGDGHFLNRDTFRQQPCDVQTDHTSYRSLCGPSEKVGNAMVTKYADKSISDSISPLLQSLLSLKDISTSQINRNSFQIKRGGEILSCENCGLDRWLENCGGANAGVCQRCKTIDSCTQSGNADDAFYLHSESNYSCSPDANAGDLIFEDYECTKCEKFHVIDGEYFLTVSCGNSQNFERWDPATSTGDLGTLPTTVDTKLCELSTTSLIYENCGFDSVHISDYESGRNKNLTFCPPGYFVDDLSDRCSASNMQIKACCTRCDICQPPQIKSNALLCTGSTAYQPYQCQAGCENGFYNESENCKLCTSCLKGMVVN